MRRLSRFAVSPAALLAATLALAVPSCAEPPAGRSIVLITLDTTRADHLGCYGYPSTNSPTPTIDALAARGVLFERHTVPMPQTLPTHATLLTGQPPRVHGALENAQVLRASVPTLAQTLSERGYVTAAFVGALVLDVGTGIERGFETFDVPQGTARDAAHPVERRADAVTDSALAWALTAHRRERPYFLWVHYYDPHGPYEPPFATVGQPAARRAIGRQPDFAGADEAAVDELVPLWNAYANEVAYVDSQVGRLLKGLGQREMLKDAVIVVVGDHGEGLMEHGEKSHGVSVYEELMIAPLIVAAPDDELAGLRVAERVASQDLLPTLLDLAGQPPAPGALAGRNLLPELRAGRPVAPRPVFVERPHYLPGAERWMRALAHGWGYGLLAGVIVGEEKLVRYPDGSQTLHHLGADPGELTDAAAAHPQSVARLGALLDEYLAAHPIDVSELQAELSPERLEILEALGYIR